MPKSERSDRRIEPRVSAELMVNFETFDEFVHAYTSNVSRTGLFVPTEKFLPAGAVVALNITLPEGGPSVRAIARVAYVLDQAKAAHSNRAAGMGMEFLDIGGGESEEQINKYLMRKAVSLPQPSQQLGPRATVLVVDDSDEYRETAATAMKAAGFDVLRADNGLEGLGVTLRETPDIILTDVNMPKMDGWQLLRLVRARPNLAHIPVIFLTTLGSDADRLRGYRLGVDDYLGKPFSTDELKARVERVLARSRAHGRPAGSQALHGDLSQVALASVLSLAEMERRTGDLLLVRENETIRLQLRDGAVVRIELPDEQNHKQGIERFFYALDWSSGQFELSAAEVNVDDEVGMPISFVLLEHARRSDEGSC